MNQIQNLLFILVISSCSLANNFGLEPLSEPIKKDIEFSFSDSLNTFRRTHFEERNQMIPSEFFKGSLDWKSIEVYLPRSKKDDLLRKLSGNRYFKKPYYITREQYHVLDFNADGKLDIIYQGRNPGGGEVDNFAFFENRGDSLYLTLKLLGTLLDINRSSETNLMDFKVWEWPCCAGQMHSIYKYHFYPKKDSLYLESKDFGDYNMSYGKFIKNNHPNFTVEYSLCYVKSTHLGGRPLKLEGRKFKVITENAVLETNPKFPFEDPHFKLVFIPEDHPFSLVISELPIGQNLTEIGKMTFEGKNYHLVRFDCKSIQSTLDLNGRDVKNLIGWINSDDIEEI